MRQIHRNIGWAFTLFTATIYGVFVNGQFEREDIPSTTDLYCKFGDGYHKFGSTWTDGCFTTYNCTERGPAKISEQGKCPQITFPGESKSCNLPILKPTDRQSCCNNQYFCESLPPHGFGKSNFVDESVFGCPNGWVEAKSNDDSETMTCLKYFPQPLQYSEAQKSCHALHGFLVNVESIHPDNFGNVSSDLRMQITGPSNQIWVGLHYARGMMVWEGEILKRSLYKECDDKKLFPCFSERDWYGVGFDTCFALNLSDPLRLQPAGCNVMKPYVCASRFTDFMSFPSFRCEDGWLYNSVTNLCVKYFSSDSSFPNFGIAEGHCLNQGGKLFNVEDKIRQHTVYSLIANEVLQPYTLWVSSSEPCTALKNPYLAEVESLESIVSSQSCYETLPFICEKQPNNEKRNIGVELKYINSSLFCESQSPSELNVRKTTTFIRNYKLVTRDENEIGNELTLENRYSEAGVYQCAIWSRELSQHIYSNSLTINFDGRIHHMWVRLNMSAERALQWLPIAKYYPSILSARESVYYQQFLQQTRAIFSTTNSYKLGSIQLESAEAHVIEVSKHGVFVSGLVVFEIPLVLTSEQRRRKRQIIIGTTTDVWGMLNLEFNDAIRDGAYASGSSAQNAFVCSSETVDVGGNLISLAAGNVGDIISRSVCALTGQPLLSATCSTSFTTGPSWKLHKELCSADKSEVSQDLQRLSLTSVNINNYQSLLTEAEQLTSGTQSLTSNDVAYVAEILTSTTNFQKSKLHKVGSTDLNAYLSSVTAIVDNVLEQSSDVIKRAESSTKSSISIVRVLESLIDLPFDQISSQMDVYSKVHTNLAYRLTLKNDVIGIMSMEEAVTDHSITYVNASEMKSSINNKKVVGLRLHDNMGGASLRRAFIVYGNMKLHQSSNATSTRQAGGRVVSASLRNFNGSAVPFTASYQDLVSIHYPRMNVTESEGACVFWDLDASAWNSIGCRTAYDEVNGVFCYCNHLTDFSVLLDINRDREIDEIHLSILNVITYVGLSISIVALGLVVISSCIRGKLRRTHSQKVLVCLALSLLGLDLSFVLGIERVESEAGCIAAAAFMHYFLLASFAWMLVEAILQYMRFVKVLGTYIPKFMIKVSIPAWLIPAFIVIIVAAVDPNLYKASDNYCWMKVEALYWAVLLPIALILVVNTVVFAMIIHGLLCARKMSMRTNQSDRALALLHLRASLSVFTLLGLTWIFAYLALIETTSLAFQYLFCIFNSLQGLLIFIFHHIREPSVQKEWRTLLCCRTDTKSSFDGRTSSTNEIRKNSLSNTVKSTLSIDSKV